LVFKSSNSNGGLFKFFFFGSNLTGGRSFLAKRLATPSSRNSYKPCGSPPRGGPRKNIRRSSWMYTLGSFNPGSTYPTKKTKIKSSWKGATYVTPGVLPLGGGHLWTSQTRGIIFLVRRCLNRGSSKNPTYTAWVTQTSREYYQKNPLGFFIRSTSLGRPIRTKWLKK